MLHDMRYSCYMICMLNHLFNIYFLHNKLYHNHGVVNTSSILTKKQPSIMIMTIHRCLP